MRSRTLIEATQFQKREDRLTEILAVVLRAFEPAALEILRQGGFHADGAEVSTQVITPLGKRPDMQIVALDSDGKVIGRLWSEHKTGAPYMEGQLDGYARELEMSPVETGLITITERDVRPDLDDRWRCFTWDEVAMWLDRLGRERTDDRRWRRGAASAGVGIWMLDELLTYLEEEHEVIIEPLDALDIVAFGRADATGETLYALLERAAEESELAVAGRPEWTKNDWGRIWQLFEPAGWSAALDGYPELHVGASDYWLNDLLGVPAFGAGLTFKARLRDPLLEADEGRWAQKAADLGFSVFEEDRLTRVYKTRYATDLVGVGTSIDEQGRSLGIWFKEAIKEIERLDPHLRSGGTMP